MTFAASLAIHGRVARSVRLTQATAATVLQAAAHEGGTLRVVFSPPYSDLASEVVLTVAEGCILQVHEPQGRTVQHALCLIALSPESIMEMLPTRTKTSGRKTTFLGAFSEAEREAIRAQELLALLGGLNARYRPSSEGEGLPASVIALLHLVDGTRTVAQILRESPMAPRLSCSVLNRFRQEGLIATKALGSLALANQTTDHESDRELLLDSRLEPLRDLGKQALAAKEDKTELSPQEGASPADEEMKEAGASVTQRWVLAGAIFALFASALLLVWPVQEVKPPLKPMPPPKPTPAPSEMLPAEPPKPAEPDIRRRLRRRVPKTLEEVLQFGTPLEQARALVQVGDAEAAEDLLVQLRDKNPSSEVWRLSGQAAVDLGDGQKALEYVGRAIARSKADEKAWIIRGSAYQFLGQTRLAVQAYERARNLLMQKGQSSSADELDQVIEALRDRSGSSNR